MALSHSYLGSGVPGTDSREETVHKVPSLPGVAKELSTTVTTSAYYVLVAVARGGLHRSVGTASVDDCNRNMSACHFNATVNTSALGWPGTNGAWNGARPSPRSTLEVVVISTVVVILSLLTAGGNLLVIAAFRLDKTLQTVSNYFLLSLAIADLTIGLVSMPLYTVYLLMGYWPLGALLCDMWLALDYTMSNASVANLIIISFDRYFSVTRPLTYRAKRTPRRAGVMICTAWIISVLLWTPWIFAWPYIEGQRNVPDTECYIQFLKTNRYMSIFTAMAAFYVPVSIMFVVYHRIYRETQKRQKDLSRLQGNRWAEGSGGSRKSNTNSSDDDECAGSFLGEKRGQSLSDQKDTEHVDVTKPFSLKRKFWLCLKIDRDSDYVEDSSSSDPSASASSSNALSTTTVTFTGYKSECVCSLGYHASSKNERPTDVPKTEIGSGSPTLPVLRVESPQVPHVVSSPPHRPPSCLTANPPSSDPCPSHAAVCSPLLEAHRKNGDLGEETKQEDEDRKKRHVFVKRIVTDSGKHRYVIELPSDKNTLYREDDGIGDSRYAGQNGCKGCIRLSADGDTTGASGINPGLLQTHQDRGMLTAVHRCVNQHSVTANNRHPEVEHSDDGSSASDTDCATAAVPARPPTGTPALARRAQSSDAQKAAQQVKIAERVAGRVRKQRAGWKVKMRRRERKQEQKAAKTLTAILLAFLVTWTPYNIFTLVETFCSGCINDTLYAIGYWLCYINSTINPLCYALCNVHFRRAFLRILMCRSRQPRSSLQRLVLPAAHVTHPVATR